jgi:nitrite reductase/ring-hydroxylating ferredoxin subunit
VAAGLADWADLEPEQRRVGLVHAATNALATGCYLVSYVARRRGRRGVLAGLLGLAAGGLGGMLGGHLAYTQDAGANHAGTGLRLAGGDWHDLGELADFPDGTPVARAAGRLPVVVCRDGAQMTVLAAACSHVAGPLHEGRIVRDGDRTCLECPWHGSRFALPDGAVLHGPATAPQPTLETRVVSGRLEARVRLDGSLWNG